MEPEPEPESDSERIYVPSEFYCPISGCLIKDPVSEPSGHTYERSCITRWLKSNSISPMTRGYLELSDLYDNISMKRSIESIKDKLQKDQLKIESKIIKDKLSEHNDILNGIRVNSYYKDKKILINIETPNIEVRAPIDIVLCIDVSYSMFDEATLKGEKNEKLSHGLSILSLTKSAAKTILNSLNDMDNISIVTYSSEAKVIIENMECSPKNKVLIEGEIDKLKPISNTNLWSGLHSSLDILNKTSPRIKNKGIILLTDGIPNVIPPRGHGYMLKKYFNENKFKCMISCYGFGHSLDSELLMELSNISFGDGYSFIPDASLLGSTFINGISNLLITAVYNPNMYIELSKGAKFLNGETKMEINIDSLKYGLSKEIVIEIDISSCSDFSYEHLQNFYNIVLKLPNGLIIHGSEVKEPTKVYYIEQIYRTLIIKKINECIELVKYNNTEGCKTVMDTLIMDIEKCGVRSEYLDNFLYDLKGQVVEALNMTRLGQEGDWFNKWGIHYLRSLQEAYNKQICNNFKDKGVSNFSSNTLNKYIDEISCIFDKLPPPKEDIIKYSTCTYEPVTQSKRLVDMSVYNNAGGGCCSGETNICINEINFRSIKAEEIKKGDKVISYEYNNGKYNIIEDEIECVVKTIYETFIKMVEINEIKLTPYHPCIFDKWEWNFPKNLREPCDIICPVLYTFVTKKRGSIKLQNYENKNSIIFATLGHNIKGDIIGHKYLGTENVINDLKRFKTYEDGYIELIPDMFKRGKDGQINKICY